MAVFRVIRFHMNEGDKQSWHDLALAAMYIVLYAMAIAFVVIMCAGCSSTSKAVSETTHETHTEQKTDSVAHIARKDSIVNTNVSLEEWWKNVIDREYWNEVHDTTFVFVRADGTTDTRTVRSSKEKEIRRDTIWRERLRDSIRTEYVYIVDSVREKSYKSTIDSLTHELHDKETIIKEMSFWSRVRQFLFAGIICLFIIGIGWFYIKFIR